MAINDLDDPTGHCYYNPINERKKMNTSWDAGGESTHEIVKQSNTGNTFLTIGQELDSFVRNCYIKIREGDGPLFVFENGKVYARLDGYRITPMEGKD